MTLTSIVRTVVSLIIVILVLVILWTPYPLKSLILKIIPNANYKLSEHAREVGSITLYSPSNKDGGKANKRLFVWFTGGAFISGTRTGCYGILNRLYDQIGDTFDIIAFDYPTRFQATLKQTLEEITKTLQPYIGLYDEYFCGGMSAGVYLMGSFVNKEMNPVAASEMGVRKIGMQIAGMICVNGVFEGHFNSDIIDWLFNFYIARGTPGKRYYTCYGIQTPKLVIGCRRDFLFPQTYKFITLEPTESHIYPEDTLTHVFPLFINLPQARDSIDRMEKWLRSTMADMTPTIITS